MTTFGTRAEGGEARRWTIRTAAIVASVGLLASVAPLSAFAVPAAPVAASVPQAQQRSAFHRHFYRGVPYPPRAVEAHYTGMRPLAADDTMDANAAEQDVAYCASRFKSYDPLSGTYLGYDGYEHACP